MLTFCLLLQQAFPNPNDYSVFMGNFSSATGTVTLVMMLLGRVIFEKFGWRVAALVTPTVGKSDSRPCTISLLTVELNVPFVR